jgi:amyloid beta A4 precursor protein-binding family B member 2
LPQRKIQDDDQIIVEARVRYLSFLGIGKNVKNCAFIVHTAQDKFVAHAFRCEPSSGALCKTIEAACKVRGGFVVETCGRLKGDESSIDFNSKNTNQPFPLSIQLRYQKCLDAHPANSRTSADSQSPNSKGIGETLKNIMNTLTFKKDGSSS